MDWRLLLGILVGSLALTCMNVGKGIQKLKVQVLTHGRAMTAPPHRRDFLIWLSGILLTASSSILLSLALWIAQKTSVVSSMAGIGLVALIVFAHFVLHERIGAVEIGGSALVIAGTAVLGALGGGERAAQVYHPEGFYRALAAFILVFGVLTTYTVVTRKLHGLIFGGLAGTLAGLALILANVALARAGNSFIGQLATVHVYLAMAIGAAAMAITQYAFLHGRAVEVVPSFNSFYILAPACMETFTFQTHLPPLQIAGMAVIVAGVIVLSATRDRTIG